jgi:DNA-directed RNA polymerase subunit RPC12/RpoP
MIEAIKLMVEALEMVQIDVKTTPNAYEAQRQAIAAGRQAIEQAEKQERYFCERCGKRLSGGIHTCTPPAEAEKQEPVCPYCHDSHTLGAVYYDQNCVGCVKRMTATPPQRKWVGLTDEEILAKCEYKELLELAAKSAGYKMQPEKFVGDYWLKDGMVWNPLTDDGDALRLAVKLGINIPTRWEHEKMERVGIDVYAATRRAIVRAAAETGKDMP